MIVISLTIFLTGLRGTLGKGTSLLHLSFLSFFFVISSSEYNVWHRAGTRFLLVEWKNSGTSEWMDINADTFENQTPLPLAHSIYQLCPSLGCLLFLRRRHKLPPSHCPRGKHQRATSPVPAVGCWPSFPWPDLCPPLPRPKSHKHVLSLVWQFLFHHWRAIKMRGRG